MKIPHVFGYFILLVVFNQGCGETRFSHTLVYESGQAAVVPMAVRLDKNYSVEEVEMLKREQVKRLMPPAAVVQAP